MQFNNNGIEKEVTVNLKPDVLYESPDEFIHLELEFELLKYFSSSSSNNIINPDTRTCTQGLLGCNGFDTISIVFTLSTSLPSAGLADCSSVSSADANNFAYWRILVIS